MDVSLAAGDQTNRPERRDNTGGLRNRLGQSQRVFPHAGPLDKVPQFGQTPGSHSHGLSRRAGREGQSAPSQLTWEQCYHPPHAVQSLPKVPCSIVRLAQEGLGDDLDVERATGGGQREGALSRCHGTVMFTYDHEIEAEIARQPSEPLGIAQVLGEGLGSVQAVEDPRMFVKRL